MKKKYTLICSILLGLCLPTSCAGNSSSTPSKSPDSTAQTEQALEEENSAPEDSAQTEETAPEAPSVTMEFDSKAYRDPNNDESYNALVYASNSGDTPVQVVIQCQAFGTEGNVISAFDQFRGQYYEKFKSYLYVPAEAESFPIGFTLPSGYGYDMSTDKEMPEIDHIEFEVLEITEEVTEDLKDHFTPGELEIKNGHIYIYVKFDQEIVDTCSALYANYTLLGYSNGVLTTVCCRNDYPYGSSSYSVSYAKDNNDSSLLVYHSMPSEPVDTWELYLGCIAGQ